ncbi:ABC transporter ATP-binding protein [Mesorhizobium marinum]|uniref:ABC transporter ATP-binding protein n=1 Tax=Mesorhizobium marinum TaxID=3228790 RepID=UPI003466182A
MASVLLENVALDFPIYGSTTQSLKRRVAKALVGGAIEKSGSKVTLVHALSDVSLVLEPGDRIGLVGHNGAGKTSLLRLIAGIYEPTGGRLEVVGRITPLLDIGHGVDPDATGYENIVLRGLYLGRNRREIDTAMPAIAEFSGLGDFLELPVRTYSAGMTSRLLFSASTHFPSDVLLIDEGIVVGDEDFQARAIERLDGLVGQAGILMISSHATDILERYCTKAVRMAGGRIVATEPISASEGPEVAS